jgi:hypothetical protein
MILFLSVVILTAAYVVATTGLIALLRWRRIAGGNAIVLGFTTFGVLSGLLAAWAWPLDSAVYANLYAVLLGDQVYTWAISWLGDPNSAQAHSTIPWLLRVPQVYVLVALVASAAAGLCVQRVYSRITTARHGHRK